MREEKRKKRIRGVLFSLQRYVVFFCLISFLITCCMLLFLNELAASTGLVLTKKRSGMPLGLLLSTSCF